MARIVAPPTPLDERAKNLLPILIVAALAAGYQGSILSTMLTYPAQQWYEPAAAQADLLAFLRLDVVLALVFVRAADRFGRRRVLIGCSLAGPVFTGLCALTNGLVSLGIFQFGSRACTTAVAILLTVYVAEEFPAGCRSWATGGLVGTAAAGSALLLVIAATADRSANAWRWPFLVPLLVLPVMMLQFRRLEESRRFTKLVRSPAAHDNRVDRSATLTALRGSRMRLLLVAAFALAIAFEQTPARQLQNTFLRSERSFTAFDVSLFGILSNAPGLIGLFLGATLSDRFGRKLFLVLGLAGFAIGDAGMYLSHGSALWMWSILGALVGGMCLPALGLYTAELFPTVIRATTNGLVTASSRIGGAGGLLAVSWFAAKRTGPTIAMTTAGLWIAIAILVVMLPETAGVELEELNDELEEDTPLRLAKSVPVESQIESGT